MCCGVARPNCDEKANFLPRTASNTLAPGVGAALETVTGAAGAAGGGVAGAGAAGATAAAAGAEAAEAEGLKSCGRGEKE